MMDATLMSSMKKVTPKRCPPACCKMLSWLPNSAATPAAKPHIATRPLTRCRADTPQRQVLKIGGSLRRHRSPSSALMSSATSGDPQSRRRKARSDNIPSPRYFSSHSHSCRPTAREHRLHDRCSHLRQRAAEREHVLEGFCVLCVRDGARRRRVCDGLRCLLLRRGGLRLCCRAAGPHARCSESAPGRCMLVRETAPRADVPERAPHLRVACIAGWGVIFSNDRSRATALKRSTGGRTLCGRRVWHQEGRTKTL